MPEKEKKRVAEDKAVIKNPVKAIRAYCLSCVGGSSYEVDKCPIPDCHLYPFRYGKNPYRSKRELTEEQKEAMVERLRKAREDKNGEPSDNAP